MSVVRSRSVGLCTDHVSSDCCALRTATTASGFGCVPARKARSTRGALDGASDSCALPASSALLPRSHASRNRCVPGRVGDRARLHCGRLRIGGFLYHRRRCGSVPERPPRPPRRPTPPVASDGPAASAERAPAAIGGATCPSRTCLAGDIPNSPGENGLLLCPETTRRPRPDHRPRRPGHVHDGDTNPWSG